MPDIRTPGQDAFAREAALNGAGALNRQLEFRATIENASLSEAADNLIQMSNEAQKAETAMRYLEQAVHDAAEAGDDKKVKMLSAQYKNAAKSAQEYNNRISQIKDIHGAEVSQVAEYRSNLLSAINLEEKRAKDKQKNLELAAKENELILKGQHDQLGLSEQEAKQKYFKNYNDIKAAKQEEKDQKVKAQFMSDDGLGGKALNIGGSLDRMTGGKFNIEAKIAQKLDKFDAGTVKALNGITSALKGIGQKLDDAIKDASTFLKNNYTQINASLKGTSKTFDSIQSMAAEELGVNRFVLQTDYLSTIAKLTGEGISFNLEERALLETIKDKTIATFDATDATLTRLVRYLGKDITSSQFGLEYTLRNTLNSVFGDSSYVNKLYDNVTSAIQDAALATNYKDITPFNSTVQTWLGYMYEYGLSDNVISRIAEGIGYLGTGNVSALANNPDLQRLFLLSMDVAGLNYADVLQQGLDVDTTNVLLKSVIAYLDEIVNNTSDNLVLQNSYANLFNMSVTDMRAIRQLANSDINYLSSSSSAKAATYNAIADISNDTLMATQIDNMLANAQYTYGFDIATDNGKYMAYKISDLIMNVTEPFTDVKGAVGTVARAAQLVSSIGKFAVTALGLMSVGKSVLSGGLGNAKSTLGSLVSLDEVTRQIANEGMVVQEGMRSSHGSTADSSDSTNKSKGLESASKVAEMVGEEKDWTTDDHDTLDILKEFEKTIMKSTTSNNYAIAVSLEGMNDDVLTSFASIFADEDAMLKTYEGKNNVIERSLFNYVDRVGVDDELLKANTGVSGSTPTTETPSSETTSPE